MTLQPASDTSTRGCGRTRIKVCGLTREQDVDAAVASGVDAIGFVLYAPSARFVLPARAAELARRLPAFVTPVLLFVNASVQEVVDAARLIPGAWLQFHGDESAALCEAAALAAGHRAWMRAARMPMQATEERPDLIEFSQRFARASAILLDAHVDGYGGGGKVFDWSLLPPSVNSHLVLSGGLTPANVTDGIWQVRSRGLSLAVDVSSGVEVSKGIKDPVKIHQFVSAVRTADAQGEFHHVPL